MADIIELTEDNFGEFVSSGCKLVEFYSKTCGPCKMLGFVLSDIAKGEDVVRIGKVVFEENDALLKENDVTGYPTMVFFKDGKEVNRLAGLQQKSKLQGVISELKAS